LDLTNILSQYIEDCPEAWRAITIHHLLTHTAGIPGFTEFPDNLRFERLPTTVEATVGRFRDKPLDFEPGTKMRYSNSGYVLLGHIIQKVTGRSYGEFIAEKIFQPLGMKQSGYDHPANILPHRAAGYSRRGTNIVNCIPFAMDTPHAAGALYSTVQDMLIWDGALYSDRLVSARTLETMFTPFKNDCVFDLRVPKNKLQTPNIRQGSDSQYDGVTWERHPRRDGGWEDCTEMHVGAIFDDKGRIMVIATH